jgi:ABC-2 type transport system permease protein
MNDIDRFFLYLFLFPRRLFVRQGIDIGQLEAILDAKLTMDNRRPASLLPRRKKNSEKKTGVRNSSFGTMLTSFLMGFFMLYTFAIGEDIQTKLTSYFSIFMLMLCMALIIDFSSVLLDTRDNLILLPRPISDRTFVMARLLHIAIRACMILLPMILPGLICMVILQSLLVFFPFLLMVLLATVFCVFLVNAAYLIILTLTTPEKFKSIITGIQIVFVVLVMAMYQFMPKLMASDLMKGVHLADFWWIRFYAPFWFANGCLLLGFQPNHADAWLGLLLSVLIPMLSVWAVVRFFAPSFNRQLGQISVGTTENKLRSASLARTSKWKLFWARVLSKSGTERIGFVFTWDLMARSREYKLKVLPQFGYMIVLSLVFFLQHNSLKAFVIILMYFSSSILTTALMQLPYSDKFKASWFFYSTPVSQPGMLLSGAFKAILAMYYVPMVIVFFALGCSLLGLSSAFSLLFGIINQVTIAAFFAYLNLKRLPFGSPHDALNSGSTFYRTLITLIPPVLLGLVHYYFVDKTWVLLAGMLLSIAGSFLFFTSLKRRGWTRMKA